MDQAEQDWTVTLQPDVAVLIAVLEEQSVTRAAGRLGMNQSSVTRSLARLHRDLGAVLVERDGRGIVPTAQALAMLPHLRRARDAALDARTALRGVLDPEAGLIRLGFLHSLGAREVPALISHFRERFPQTTFGLRQDCWDAVLRGVEDGELDLALLAPPPESDDDCVGKMGGAGMDTCESQQAEGSPLDWIRPSLAVKPLRADPLVLVVPPGHRLAGRAGVDLVEIAGEPSIALTAGHGLRRVTDALIARAGLRPAIAFEVENADTLRGMVSAGLGIGIAEPGLGHPAVEVPIIHPRAERLVAAVWNRDRVPLPVARTFREFVVTQGPSVLAAHPRGQHRREDRSL